MRDVVPITAVVVAGDIAGRAVVDRARLAAENVPDGRLLAVGVVRSLDLVGAGRDAEDEALREGARRDDRVVRASPYRHIADHFVSAHFSTPVMTTPRMNAR